MSISYLFEKKRTNAEVFAAVRLAKELLVMLKTAVWSFKRDSTPTTFLKAKLPMRKRSF